MAYRVRLYPFVSRELTRLGLSDFVIVEVHLRLREHLGANPPAVLVRTLVPFDGMTYLFAMVDPENRFAEHRFAFHVKYLSDEQTLVVVGVRYDRTVIA